MTKVKDTTTVQQVDIDLADILGSGVDNVMVPGETPPDHDKKKKPSIFSKVTPDTSFLDNPPAPTGGNEPPAGDPPVADPPEGDPPAGDPPANDPLATDPPAADPPPVAPEIDPLAQPGADPLVEDDEKNKGGRPTVMVGALKKLFEDKTLLPFEDDKKIEDYTQADIQELIQANLESQKEQLQSTLPQEFFGNLVPEMQQAYSYLANGGTDIKGLFQSMASTREIQEIDTSTEQGQIHAVRSYLQATQFGTPEEIEDRITTLQDRGDIATEAAIFKPKLDAMSQEAVNQKLAAQEAQNNQRARQSQMYMDNVYGVLEKGELNGLKLDNRTQNMLYAGLVQPNYSSATGKQTNQLGHLLEKYQWIEPNHGLIAEALWLLADADGYRAEIRKQGANVANEDTVRRLKTEEANKSGASPTDTPDNGAGRSVKRPGLNRPKKNFFGRQ